MAQVQMTLQAKEWDRFIDGLRDKSRLRAGLKAIGRIVMFKEAIDHFKTESGPTGLWPRRKQSTQTRMNQIKSGKTTRASWEKGAYKLAGSPYAVPKGTTRAQWNPSNKLLQMTGYLRKAFSQTNIRQKTDEVVLFNAAKYSGYHDEGSPSGNLPQRSFMWLSNEGIGLAGKMLMEFWTGEQK